VAERTRATGDQNGRTVKHFLTPRFAFECPRLEASE
jgi:hypothetical protein